MSGPFTPSEIVARVRRPPRGNAAGRPYGAGVPLNVMGPVFANFNNAGDEYVIKSGLESNWVTA